MAKSDNYLLYAGIGLVILMMIRKKSVAGIFGSKQIPSLLQKFADQHNLMVEVFQEPDIANRLQVGYQFKDRNGMLQLTIVRRGKRGNHYWWLFSTWKLWNGSNNGGNFKTIADVYKFLQREYRYNPDTITN